MNFWEKKPHERRKSYPCHEGFGLVAIDAFACGVPVIASRSEVMHEIVHDGHTGLHFTSGDSDDLAKTIAWAWTHPRPDARDGTKCSRGIPSQIHGLTKLPDVVKHLSGRIIC
jgi:glycosyltransferase involved in cell wall biosynthesis